MKKTKKTEKRIIQMSTTMNKKYVFLDVDGTLVNFKTQIPESTIKALKEAQNNGHKMIICTGRQKSQIYKELLSCVKFDGIIASSAAYIELDGEVIFESRPKKEKLDYIIDCFHEWHTPYCLQTTNAIYVEHDDLDEIYNFMRERGNSEKLINSVLVNCIYTTDPKSCDCVEKIAYYNCPYDLDTVRHKLGDYYHVVGYSLGTGNGSFHGEVTFDGITKATGIEILMNKAGADIKDSIAVGDSENDLEMLRLAGYSVCMGNGSLEAKAAADLVTSDIDDDGIYNAFKKIGII